MSNGIEGKLGVFSHGSGHLRSWSNDPGFSSWRELAERFVWRPLDTGMEVAVIACALVTLGAGAITGRMGQYEPSATPDTILSASILSGRAVMPMEPAGAGCVRVKHLSPGGIHELRS
jgi:uncharacterized membrane protein YbhN (UPF0104 family)